MDVQARCLEVLQAAYPAALTAQTVADEIGAEVHAAGRALSQLDADHKLVRVRSQPNSYRVRAAVAREGAR